MKKIFCRFSIVSIAAFLAFTFAISPVSFAQGEKIGYVDLRRAFYEYEKSRTFDKEINDLTTERNEERNKIVEEVRKIRDEAEFLSDDKKAAKQTQMDAKIAELNEFDRVTRQEILNKKNDMFREVIEDIQKVVDDIGKKEKYDYILDSRNVMYAKEEYDLTERVLKELNR